MTSANRLSSLAYAGLVLLVAFGLRVYRLDGQSLWYDEGNSALMTGRSVPEIIAGAAADIHPPLYYILLSWWSAVGGANEFGLRFLSVSLGILLLAVVFAIGKKLFTARAGLFAAGIGAVSPFLVYYSQEARMYMLGAFLCVLAGFSLMKTREDRRYWIAYALASASALYTQYYALGVILALNVFFAAAILVRRKGEWRGWLGANLGVAFLYLPWLPVLFNQASLWPRVADASSAADGPAQWLSNGALLAGLGPVIPKDPSEAAGVVGFLVPGIGLLLLAGLAWPVLGRSLAARLPGRFQRPSGLLVVATVAVLSWGSLLVPFWRVPFQPKFLIFGLPWFYLWMGLGASALLSGAGFLTGRVPLTPRRVLRVPFAGVACLPLVSFCLAAFIGLQWYFFDPRFYRDDYRAVARQVQLQARPGDAIILNAPGQLEIFGYYYRGDSPVYPLPTHRPMKESAAAGELEAIASVSGRVWAVLWAQRESDPNGFIERWLDQKGFKTSDRWFGGVRLVLYTLAGSQVKAVPVNARLGDQARLVTATLRTSPGSDPGALARVSAGEVIPLTLEWEALAAKAELYKVFVHLLGPNATLWGQHDAEPAGGAHPTNTWKPGQSITDNHGLPAPPGTPPGMYEIEVGLYDMQTGRRLPVFDAGGNPAGDRVVFQPIEVVRPAVFPALDSIAIERPMDLCFGDVSLLGYELFKLGTEPGRRDFRSGDIAHVGLFWRSDGPSKPAAHPITVVLLDEAGREVSAAGVVAGQEYPTDRWDPGELVRAQYKVSLGIPPGAYRLAVEVGGATPPVQPGGAAPKVVDGKLILAEIQVK